MERSKRVRRKKFKKYQLGLFIIGLVVLGVILCFLIVPRVTGMLKRGDGKFVQENGATYYISGKEKLKGLQTISGEKYDFDLETGAMKTGFQTVNGKTVYFDLSTGKMETGLHEINGYYYYFESDGTDNVLKAYEAVAKTLDSGNSSIEGAISKGLKLVGNSPYVYGGGRTDASVAKNEFDCSSFVAYMYRKAGLPLVYQYAASTTLLAETGTAIGWSNKSRGDLLVTASNASEDEQHVAIYLGDGFILHDSTSTNGVAVSRLNEIINEKVLGNMTWAELFESGTVRREI